MTSIFDDTLLAQVLNFNGELIPVSVDVPRKPLIKEDEFGELSTLEQVIYTLYRLKMKEREELIAEVAEVSSADLKEDWQFYAQVFQEKAQPAERELVSTLFSQAKFFENLLWALVKLRIPGLVNGKTTVYLNPGYKIIAGVDFSQILGSMFPFGGGGFEVHIIDMKEFMGKEGE